MKKPNVIFMGSSEISVKPLMELINNYNVIAVVTQKDAPVGRKKILTPTPVKVVATSNNIKVFTPANIKKEYTDILSLDPDVIVTCSYGQIIPKEIIDYPKYGCINIHASLLPKYRGGAPIQRAIMNDEAFSGVTIMYMDEHMDTGDMICSEKIKIEDTDNLSTLSDKISSVGSNLIIETINNIINGKTIRTKQNDEEATYAPIIKKDDELLNFDKTAREVFNKIRAINPNPGSYFKLNNKIIKVYESKVLDKESTSPGLITNISKEGIEIDCADKKILITKIKPEGKKIMLVKDYINGIKKENFIGKCIDK